MIQTYNGPDDLTRWAVARPLLRTCIYPAAFHASRGETITREDFPGLLTTVAIDLPDQVAIPQMALLEDWGKSKDEVFEIARASSLEEKPEVRARKYGTVGLVTVETAEMYTTAHALEVERHLPSLGPAGALVTLPTHDAVLFHRIGQASVSSALMVLGRVARGLRHEGSRPLTRGVYWWRRGRPTRWVGNTLDDGIAMFMGPDIARDELMAAAAELAFWS